MAALTRVIVACENNNSSTMASVIQNHTLGDIAKSSCINLIFFPRPARRTDAARVNQRSPARIKLEEATDAIMQLDIT
jgi:hypothetical protein